MHSSSARQRPKSTSLDIPQVIIDGLKTNLAAKLAFDRLSHSHKREYILWVLGTKLDETRQARVKTMLTMLTSQQKNA